MAGEGSEYYVEELLRSAGIEGPLTDLDKVTNRLVGEVRVAVNGLVGQARGELDAVVAHVGNQFGSLTGVLAEVVGAAGEGNVAKVDDVAKVLSGTEDDAVAQATDATGQGGKHA